MQNLDQAWHLSGSWKRIHRRDVENVSSAVYTLYLGGSIGFLSNDSVQRLQLRTTRTLPLSIQQKIEHYLCAGERWKFQMRNVSPKSELPKQRYDVIPHLTWYRKTCYRAIVLEMWLQDLPPDIVVSTMAKFYKKCMRVFPRKCGWIFNVSKYNKNKAVF